MAVASLGGVRLRLPVFLAAAGLLLAGCGTPTQPEVSFYAGGESVAIEPTLYCSVDFSECGENPEAGAELEIPPGEPLQISLPKEVSDAPWLAVFRYETADGEQGPESRTKVFEPGTQHAYTLQPPGGDDRLTEVQINRIVGLQPPAAADGELEFVSNATWTLRAAD
ncbi:uncharacterized protein DUF2771 [Tamaricihabitans halophyticus]|uniref:Uncharacterized protein DUF2771 n=1 Tax=Tamaricihabitans halophyticus TaxID=1262583 RepID=A0A4R2R3V2_9PSEU|nr:uncharacterized protein DUF2771 [Tamaricihabitans halophyticus]